MGTRSEDLHASSPPARPSARARNPVVESILDLIGETPLVRLHGPRRGAEGAQDAHVWAKMEQANPTGSVKDRICLAMIEAAEAAGELRPGGTVVEPTSGNTGVGLALACSVKGYRCILTMPESMSLERRQLLEAFGAQIVLTPEDHQMEGAIAKANEIANGTPGAFVPHQFDNPANPAVHARTTALEILDAMAGLTIDAFVVGVGTGGTISGVGEVFRRELPARQGKLARIVGVEPDACATITRGERGPTKIQGLAAGFVPRNYRPELVDEVRTVRDADAWRTKLMLARTEGLLVGVSSGAAVHVAFEVARELGAGKNVVTVLADTGERYFSLAEYFPEVSAT